MVPHRGSDDASWTGPLARLTDGPAYFRNEVQHRERKCPNEICIRERKGGRIALLNLCSRISVEPVSSTKTGEKSIAATFLTWAPCLSQQGKG